MIFGVFKTEAQVQTFDKTRINCTKSFTTPDEAAVTLVEIRPSATDNFITIVTGANATDSSLWYLDWFYVTTGTKTIELRITTDGSPVSFTQDIVILDKATEKLFSNDNDLYQIEPEIFDYVPKGKCSFIYLHREVRESILEDIYRNRIFDVDQNKLTVDQVINTAELKYWSKYRVLRMIFESISNATDDVFSVKAEKYQVQENAWQQQTFNVLRLDYNKNDEIDDFDKADEQSDIRSGEVVRR